MHVILDFDGTVTSQDTIGTIAALAVEHHQQQSGADLQPAWDAILKHYGADYKAYCEAADVQEHARTEVEHEVAFQRGLRELDEASVERVTESGLFRAGFGTEGNLRRRGRECIGGGRVTVRRGFGDFVRRVSRQNGGKVSVLSVSWSAEFVGGVIGAALEEGEEVPIRVVANEISTGGRIEGPAWVCGRHTAGQTLATSEDKMTAMELVVSEKEPAEGQEERDLEEVRVYVGDSTTDLECLLAATHGIVMANDEDSKLLRTLRRMRFRTVHVSEEQDDEDEAAKRIVWARDFEELLSFFEREGLLPRG